MAWFRGDAEVSLQDIRQILPFVLHDKLIPDHDSPFFDVPENGMLRVEHRHGIIDVAAGQAVIVNRGEWVRYSTPGAEGAAYIAVCVPAFSPLTVHRDSA